MFSFLYFWLNYISTLYISIKKLGLSNKFWLKDFSQKVNQKVKGRVFLGNLHEIFIIPDILQVLKSKPFILVLLKLAEDKSQLLNSRFLKVMFEMRIMGDYI